MKLHFGARLEMAMPDFESLLAQAKAAEAGGFEGIWVPDHLHNPDHGDPDDKFECWTSMAALARETTTVSIGSLVSCTPFRNPALVAKMATTLDQISNGRAMVGIGAGGQEREFREYGFDLPSRRDRALMLREAAQILKGMCGAEPIFSFEGKYYRVDNAVNEPRPKREGGLPIIIGTSSKQIGIETVARYGDGWSISFGWQQGLSSAATDQFTELHDALQRHCEAIGRDPAAIDIYVGMHVLIAPTHEEAQRRKARSVELGGGAYLGERWFAGTAEGFMDLIKPWVDRGVRNFIAYFHERGHPYHESVTEFADLVIKRL